MMGKAHPTMGGCLIEMTAYRRYFVPGGTYFFTLTTYERQPIFADLENISKLRLALLVYS